MALLKTVVGGAYKASDRDILVVRLMLNEVRSRHGQPLLSSRAVVDSELLQAIEDFQRRNGIRGNIEIAQGDATYKALHAALDNESEGDNRNWEKADAYELKDLIRAQSLWATAEKQAPSVFKISWPAKDTALSILALGGGLVTITEKLSAAGVSLARRLHNLAAWCEVALRIGQPKSWVINTAAKSLFNSQAAKFLRIFESGERALAMSNKLEKIAKFGAGATVLLAMPQLCTYLRNGQCGAAFGYMARVAYACLSFPVAVFEIFETVLLWLWPSLANNFCWKILTSLNPARHAGILVDLWATICHLSFHAGQENWASVNAVLNDFADRWESDPLNIFTETFGIAIAVFTRWFAEQMADLFDTEPPAWAYYLLDYYKTKLKDMKSAAPQTALMPGAMLA